MFEFASFALVAICSGPADRTLPWLEVYAVRSASQAVHADKALHIVTP